MNRRRVDSYCTLPHYAEHVLPVLAALPDEYRGRCYLPVGLHHDPIARTLDVDWGAPPDTGGPVIVAGYQDLPMTRRPKVLLSHGAGQTYVDDLDNPGHEGGAGRELVDLFLTPNEHAAELNRARYPGARAVAVGCPKLDALARIPKPHNDAPVVAVAFHWNCRISIESGWAWPTWAGAIVELAKWMKVLGHCHPRARAELGPWYRDNDIETVWSVPELLARAGVLVVDNSSLGFEWSACDRPVVWIDDASWRPNVAHGLRFGEQLPGPRLVPSLASVRELADSITISCNKYVLARDAVARRIYGPVDGHASERAAAAVMQLAEERSNV